MAYGAPRTHDLSPATFEKLRQTSTATLTSQLLKRGFRNVFLGGLQALRPDLRMVGYAFTLRYAPTREDVGFEVEYDNETNVQRLAVEAIGEDEVLVIDARGETRAASFGHILATRIKNRGAAGLVSDGALRDTPAFREMEFPTYIKAPHATTSSVVHYPVDMNVPVGCGGVLVMPGDVVVGDAEGVVVIPARIAESVAQDAFEQELLEEFVLSKVRAGSSIKGVYPPDEKTLAEYSEWRRRSGEDS
ncbi:ribonuclease activity regulator RraA [Rubrobacter taiwanensis]|uniref:Putative 4-hydroxy-4-methyl-2-oxoglutarate aldolase n=1 Tax=Rubrobacter taiwanensis TaxID=185139 RepID=A0A4R1BQK8_9ACTN|nr:ribonuclease activity regulator RraA [Rubrobacter taiwanensis]TCJ19980.1 ribonuclease activity regulator RraA [Rubrobacter taiwanensis]